MDGDFLSLSHSHTLSLSLTLMTQTDTPCSLRYRLHARRLDGGKGGGVDHNGAQ